MINNPGMVGLNKYTLACVPTVYTLRALITCIAIVYMFMHDLQVYFLSRVYLSQHLKWENAVDQSMNIQRIKRKEGGRDMWYYIMLHQAGEDYREAFILEFTKDHTLKLGDWGYVPESGEEANYVENKARQWTTVAYL